MYQTEESLLSLEKWNGFPPFPIPVPGEDHLYCLMRPGHGFWGARYLHSCLSVSLFASAQPAPTGKVATGERWTLMGHPLICSGTDLGWVWSLTYPRCPPDMSSHNLPSPTHYKKLPLVECNPILLVPCAVPNIPAEQERASRESRNRLSPSALLVREH